MNLWIGTSGFQYPEWKGSFYPDKMPAAKMLPYYAERFASTEINYSFRRIPSLKTLENWSGATPGRFKFSLKAPQQITHFAQLRDCADTLRYFHETTSTLEVKLGAVLFQLPPTLKKDTSLLAAFLDEMPPRMCATFEFRHESWFADDVFATLRERRAALCIAESEKLATPTLTTADFGYVRLRREDYTKADIERWAGFVRNQTAWREAFVYFKHEDAGVGPAFARQLKELLDA